MEAITSLPKQKVQFDILKQWAEDLKEQGILLNYKDQNLLELLSNDTGANKVMKKLKRSKIERVLRLNDLRQCDKSKPSNEISA